MAAAVMSVTGFLLSAVGGYLVEEPREECGQATGWELERLGLGRSGVQFCRPACAGTASAKAAGEGDREQAGAQEPLESATGDAAVDAQGSSGVVRSYGFACTAHVQQRVAQFAPCDPVEPVQAQQRV
jgi:hypothetical protein